MSALSTAKTIILDGLIIDGGLFAVLTTFLDFLFAWYRHEQGFGSFFSASETWYRFLFSFLFFGLIMGITKWVRKLGSKVESYKITGS
jgi:hypothetical protein